MACYREEGGGYFFASDVALIEKEGALKISSPAEGLDLFVNGVASR